ncbi:hypothetical protein D3C75_1320310 [compost metagenome]
MSEALRDKKLLFIVTGQFNAEPLPIVRTTLANIHSDIKNSSFSAADELALCFWI